jgi:hypothetical protein
MPATTRRRKTTTDSPAKQTSTTNNVKPPNPPDKPRSSCLWLAVRFSVMCALVSAAACGLALLVFDAPSTAHLPASLRPFRPLPIRVMNAVNVALRTTLGVDLIPLEANAMVDAACTQFNAETNNPAGSTCDWGDSAEEYGDFKGGLNRLVDAMLSEAELTLIGRLLASHRISMILVQRLHLVDYWKGEHTALKVRYLCFCFYSLASSPSSSLH